MPYKPTQKGPASKEAIRIITIIFAPVMLALLQPVAMAQGKPGKIEEIIVTATKREQALSDIAAAANAYDRERLRTSHISDVHDLQLIAPSLTVGEVFDVARIFIRGVGTNVQNPGSSGGVAVYTDGAPIARQEAQLTSLFDLERIEVLRGPQGTLYGRNAVGGAINYITAKPTDEFEGYGRATFGNYNAVEIETAMGGPITDWIKARAAFKSIARGGFGKNIVTNSPINDANRNMARLSFIIEPTDSLSIFLSGEWYNQDDSAGVLTVDGGVSVDPVTGEQTTNAGPVDPETGELLVDLPGLGGFAENPRDKAASLDPFTRKERWSVTGHIDWSVNDWLTISNITNVQEIISTTSEDQGSASFRQVTRATPLTRVIGDEPQASTELQFKTSTDWLNGILGVIYFTEKQTENQTLGSDGALSLINTNTTSDFLLANNLDPVDFLEFCGDIGQHILAESGLPDNPAFICGRGRQDIDALGVYANWTVSLGKFNEALSAFSMRLGARYSHDERTVSNPFFFFGNDGTNATSVVLVPDENVTSSATFEDVSPEVGIEWRPTNNYLFYSTYSQGFKAGTGLTVPGATELVGPEELENYEFGFKGSFLDQRLAVNISAFSNELEGAQFQRSQPGPILGFTTVLENAAGIEAKGIELEVQSVLLESDKMNVRFNAHLNYLDSKFTDFVTIDPTDPGLVRDRRLTSDIPAEELPVQNLAGNPTREAPKWSGTAHAEIDFPALSLPGDGMLTLSGNVNYKSRNYLTEFNKIVESAEPRTVVNMELTYRTPGGVTLSAWGRNLTDELFKTGVTYVNAVGGLRSVTLFPPRTYGVTIGYDF